MGKRLYEDVVPGALNLKPHIVAGDEAHATEANEDNERDKTEAPEFHPELIYPAGERRNEPDTDIIGSSLRRGAALYVSTSQNLSHEYRMTFLPG